MGIKEVRITFLSKLHNKRYNSLIEAASNRAPVVNEILNQLRSEASFIPYVEFVVLFSNGISGPMQHLNQFMVFPLLELLFDHLQENFEELEWVRLLT